MTGKKLAAWLIPFALAGAIVFFGFQHEPTESAAQVGGGGQPCASPGCLLPLDPGSPEPWQTGAPVGTFTSVNLANGNMLTAVPIVGWSGVGPALVMNFYHNAANVNSGMNLTRGMGFDLGEGWTTSYSAQLIKDTSSFPMDEVTAVADDGTRSVYNLDRTNWVAPAGVHSELTYTPATKDDPAYWRLTHKDQSFHEFDDDGLLTRVVDATGHDVTIQRNASDAIDTIADAAGRILEFEYDVNGNLEAITDPAEVDEPSQATLTSRSWSVSYDVDDRLSEIEDPVDPNPGTIEFSYDNDGRITTLTDQDGNAFDYAYTNGLLTTVTDPVGNTPRLTQDLAYVYCSTTQISTTTYTSRRGGDWEYDFNIDGEFIEARDPIGNSVTMAYDSDHNVTTYTDGMSEQWTYTYDTDGNLLTVTDPLTNVQEWEYDTYNNLTSYTDADSNETLFAYQNVDYPTLLTQVTHPAVGNPATTGTTTIAYFGDNEDGGYPGQLKLVTDPNGVTTGYDYDKWGQVLITAEGKVDRSKATAQGHVTLETHADSASRIVFTSTEVTNGMLLYNPVNHPTDLICPPVCKTPGADPASPANFPTIPYTEVAAGPMVFADAANTFTAAGLMTESAIDIDRGGTTYARTHSVTYDELGRVTEYEITSNESGAPTAARTFTYSYDDANGLYTRTGPDGVDTFSVVDTAGRVVYWRRGPAATPLLEASYTYDANNRVSQVSYRNGARVFYTYDEAGRLELIEHKVIDPLTTILGIEYTWTDNNLVSAIREYNSVGDIANVSFSYDARGRLTQETRTGTSPYNYSYGYDQGGNRISKTDVLADVKTYYYYDIDIAGYSASENNRLMYYEVYEDASSTPVLASTTYYYYNIMGNPIRVLTETEVQVGKDKEYMYEATRMVYARNGQAVTYAIGETYDPRETPAYSFEYAKEFRYDGARQRYLVRELNQNMALISEKWSDYDGDSIYGSYSVTSGTANELMSYEPGIGQVDTSLATPVSKYYHTDMIGTTKLLTDGISAATSGGSVLTAFGEHVTGLTHRYGYAGAYGYQTDDGSSDAFPFMHVGHRYYDPSTGRFLQRDPIGINGGLNVYEYVGNNPVLGIDPDGLFEAEHWENMKKCRGAYHDAPYNPVDSFLMGFSLTVFCAGPALLIGGESGLGALAGKGIAAAPAAASGGVNKAAEQWGKFAESNPKSAEWIEKIVEGVTISEAWGWVKENLL